MFNHYNFNTAQGTLALQCIDVEEPNNGRMLFKVLLLLNGIDVTAQYFDNWHYINFNLENYKAVSSNNKYIYIPKENSHFIINTNTLEKTELPKLLLSAITFIRNEFYKTYLIVLATTEAQIIQLENKKIKSIKPNIPNTNFIDFNIQENKIVFYLSNNKTLVFELL